MIVGEMEIPKKQYVSLLRVTVDSGSPGLIVFDVEIGSKVEKGDRIGYMFNPIDQLDSELISPSDGILFSAWANNQVKAGVEIFTILVNGDDGKDRLHEMGSFTLGESIL